MRNKQHVLLVGALLSSIAWAGYGRCQIANAATTSSGHLSFDVVSIRPSAKQAYSHWHTGTDGFTATNVTAQQLVFFAYGQAKDGAGRILTMDQILNLPKWADGEQFDVTAKADAQVIAKMTSLSLPERSAAYQQMWQPVLMDRFHLQAHRETRERPIYLLQVAQSGSKLTSSNVPFAQSSLSEGRGQLKATGYKLDALAEELTKQTGRPVLDRTHLQGTYDFQLKWHPEDETAEASASPSIFTALKEQLGLELASSKGPVDFIVVTNLDRPTAN